MIIINFKNYSELSYSKGIKVLAEVAKSDLNLENVFFAPAINDLSLFKNIFQSLNFISQNLEDSKVGSTTGHLSSEILSEIGIKYTLLNHSENRLGIEKTKELIETFKKQGINVVACCESIEEATQLDESNPFAIAFEPKELIGSGISVTTKPDIVTAFTNSIKGSAKKFIGAGVSTGEDISTGKKLGAEGFILASAFAKAENRIEKLGELINEKP